MDTLPSQYLQFHQRRYQFLLELLERVSQTQRPFTRLLDIGLSYQTLQFQEAFPHATIDTLGYFDHRFTGAVESLGYEDAAREDEKLAELFTRPPLPRLH